MPVLLEDGRKAVEYLGAHAQGVTEGLGAHGHDHEFLDVEVVRGVRAAVDDVHHRGGQDLGVDAAQVAVKRLPHEDGGRAGACHGGAQHGVGAQVGLVVGVVEVDQGVVDLHLAENVLPDEGLGDLLVHMGDGLGHALAAEAFLVAVAHLQGLAAAGGGAGRHCRAFDYARFKADFDFDGGIAAGIKDLTAVYGNDGAHASCSFVLHMF